MSLLKWMLSWIVFGFCSFTSAAAVEVRRAIPVSLPAQADINDLCRFIAGIPPSVESPLIPYTTTPEWINHSATMNEKWRTFEAARLLPIRLWRTSAMSGIHPGTLFYPFSGPDFVYAETFFPEARHFILCGLEPVGTPPSVEKLFPLSVTLGWLQVSMRTVLDAGYFITKDMRVDLSRSPLQGALPLLCVMLARAGDSIVSIHSDKAHAEIRYLRAADGQPATVDYFSVNLRDDGLRNGGGGFVDFVKQSRPGAAYFKAASYLMHEPDFAVIRSLVLSTCPVIVQDDSGIPLRSFDLAKWNVRVFGTYAPPLEIFQKYYQPEMAQLYSSTTPEPLGFGAGYHWNGKTANLMIYTRK